MTNVALLGVAILSVLGLVTAFAGEYVPKAYYTIDREGHQSDMVYLPLFRRKRGVFSSSSASASASSSSSAGSGSPIYFGGQDFFPNIPNGAYSNVDSNAYNSNNNGGNGGHPGGAGASSFASASSSSNSGYGNQHGHPGGIIHQRTGENSGPGPQLFSRFGEGEGSGIHVSGSASGKKGAFSSSSSSVDGNGKVKYSIQTGKLD